MINVVEVKTKKQQKQFLDFPLELYKDNDNFVPPLYGDEKKIFRPDYIYYDTCEAVYFNAYDESGKMVGRISGILQKASNEKHGERRVRFNRFDAINDEDVAKALFCALEEWALDKGMDTICGPLGFSDLEREGLLVEGFDELATFEEQYNADYYGALIQKCGYAKEVDWVESRIYPPKQVDEELKKMSDFIMKRYKLTCGTAKTKREFLDKYKDGFFDLLDTAYEGLYGTVPFTDGMKKMLIDNFMLIIDLNNITVLLDKNGRVVCFGLCFPSIARALQKSKGKLTPAALIRLFKAIKHPKTIDLGLVAVAPEYLNRGVAAIVVEKLAEMLVRGGYEYAETNLNLETNHAVRNMWKRFESVEHKRRRSYVKVIERKEDENV